MKIVDLSKQDTILNRFLTEIRDVEIQKDQLRFRRNIERIGEIMAYEISKELTYAAETVPTQLGEAVHNVPADKVYRPAAWGAFGAQDPQGADYRACAAYGPLYGTNK